MKRSRHTVSPLEELSIALHRAGAMGELIPVVLHRSAALLAGDWIRLVESTTRMSRCWSYDGAQITERRRDDFDDMLIQRSGEQPGRAETTDYSWGGSAGQVLYSRSDPTHDEAMLLAVGRTRRTPFKDPDHRLLEGMLGLITPALRSHDMVQRIRDRSVHLEHTASHDTLTSLPNRLHFMKAATAAIEHGRAGAILIIDLDRFKEVNDTLGHHIGDEMLVEVAARITRSVGNDGLVARLGGDEFAVLLQAGSPEEILDHAYRIHENLERPLGLADPAVSTREFAVDVGASIGVAHAGPGSEPIGTLLRRADVAMYASKANRTGVTAHTAELDHHRPESLELVSRFRGAVMDGDLHVAFQPQFDTITGRIIGAEALARWSLAGVGPIPPTEFIPIAESTGLIRPLTTQVMMAAIGQCARWQEGTDPLRVSVNISPRVLLEPGLADGIDQLLAAAGLPPERLRVEVTETTVMTDPRRATRVLEELTERGMSVAIDDFGTGHSSLSYLTTLPCHEIKIDQSFIAALTMDDRRSVSVIGAIIGLAQDLGIDVIAEGVETEQVADRLRALGCQMMQGYLYGRPISPGKFMGLVERRADFLTPDPAVVRAELAASLR